MARDNQPAAGLNLKRAHQCPKPGDSVQEAHGMLAAGRLEIIVIGVGKDDWGSDTCTQGAQTLKRE